MIVRFWSVCLLLASGLASVHAQELGTITFETSGAPAAQPKFLEGVKALHSFQFDEAAVAFREAKTRRPELCARLLGRSDEPQPPALGATGPQAANVCSNRSHRRARRAREGAGRRSAPCSRRTKSSLRRRRQARARPRVLPGTRRDLRALSRRSRNRDMYALSLLGTTRPGDTGFRRQALAASIAGKVFAENPQHPGAAHFIIHSFDDPDHAPLALPAARAYAKSRRPRRTRCTCRRTFSCSSGSGPTSLQSNVVAYKAAVEINKRMNLAEGREDFHTLDWLTYGNLMLGRFDDARANVERARRRPPSATRPTPAFATATSRCAGATCSRRSSGKRSRKDGTDAHAAHEGGHARHAARASGRRRVALLRRRQRRPTRRRGSRRTLRSRSRQAPRAGRRTNAYGARGVAIQEKQVAALAKVARGDRDAAPCSRTGCRHRARRPQRHRGRPDR